MNISILIPCYNCNDSIERAANSVLYQNNIDQNTVKIIICDDGSNLATKNILKHLQQKHSEISVITNDKNMGTYYSR